MTQTRDLTLPFPQTTMPSITFFRGCTKMNFQSDRKIASGSFEARAKFRNGKTEWCTVDWKIGYYQKSDREYVMYGHDLEYEIKSHGQSEEETSFYGILPDKDIAKVIRGGSESEKLLKSAISMNEDKCLFRFVNRK